MGQTARLLRERVADGADSAKEFRILLRKQRGDIHDRRQQDHFQSIATRARLSRGTVD